MSAARPKFVWVDGEVVPAEIRFGFNNDSGDGSMDEDHPEETASHLDSGPGVEIAFEDRSQRHEASTQGKRSAEGES